jgi:uncharacterized protein YjbI with pentapeptide repeats
VVGSPDVPQHPTPTVDLQLPWLEYRSPVVQTALMVLGRRPRYRDELRLNLSRTDLRGAFLDYARLSNALLRHANLARARMAKVQLENADLSDADLRQANLRRARLTGASLRKAHLQGADMRDADLRGAKLQGACLEGAKLKGAHADRKTTWPEGFKAVDAGIVIDPSADPAEGRDR